MLEIHLQTIDSTNLYAKQHSHHFVKTEITCITADEQTAGRGRYQRKWLSLKDQGLYTTFYFTLPANTPHLTSLAQVIALSLAKVLQKEGLKPDIKWPNDVRLSCKKLAGILCETQFQKEFVEIFLGLGINVNLDAKRAALIDQPATSLFIETHRQWDKKALLKKLQGQFVKDLELFKTGGFTPFRETLEELLAFKGEKLRCFDGKRIWVGICHSLTENGQLNLLLEDNTLHTLSSGDILQLPR